MTVGESAGFRYAALAPVGAFGDLARPDAFIPLPSDWVVCVTDVVESTRAIEAGRYKAVNIAGAAIVAAVSNALGSQAFPFVFGGDGAVLAVPPEWEAPVRGAAAATQRGIAEDLALDLRAGILSVAAIRAAGHDMRVARLAASGTAAFAMFAGGGATFAAAELKAGRIAVPPAPPGTRPDLSGLSCRWAPIQSRHGVILSVLVSSGERADPDGFAALVRTLLALLDREDREGHPVQPEGPRFGIAPQAIRMEAVLTRTSGQSALKRGLSIVRDMAVAIGLDRTGRTAGRFDPRHYRQAVAANSDFRKYEDGLRMTVDCRQETAAAIENLLAEAERRGLCRHGLHRQDAALMTCIVPSYFSDDHLHFLDGAGGGYALAARAMKGKGASSE